MISEAWSARLGAFENKAFRLHLRYSPGKKAMHSKRGEFYMCDLCLWSVHVYTKSLTFIYRLYVFFKYIGHVCGPSSADFILDQIHSGNLMVMY